MRRKYVLAIAVTAVLVAAGIGGYLWLNSREQGPGPAQEKKLSEAEVKYNAAAKEADAKSESGDDAAAEAAIQQYLATQPPKEQANDARLKLAAAYQNQQKYDEAIAEYEKVGTEDDETKIAVLQGLGYAYEGKDEYGRAIEYFTQVVDTLKLRGNKDGDRIVETNRNHIEELQQRAAEAESGAEDEEL
ncbi:tetratricopeptide repeat protein [Candidatus Saccharibacteria bacterium]|nr:tetratricopeptide repeat protein [Candidatus Saccharibacteria bacterium]